MLIDEMNKKLEEILANHRFHCDRYYLKNGNFQYCRHGNYFCSDAVAIKEAFTAGENSYLPCSKAGCVKHASCCDDCEKKAEQKGRQEVFDSLEKANDKRTDEDKDCIVICEYLCGNCPYCKIKKGLCEPRAERTNKDGVK